MDSDKTGIEIPSIELGTDGSSSSKPRKRGGPPKTELTDEQITAALTATRGLITNAAKVLQVDLRTLRKMLKPIHIQHIADLREELTDMAEQNLFRGVERGDPRATELWLKYQAKNRGYTEKQEVKIEGQVTTEDSKQRRASITGLLAKLGAKAAGSNGTP